MLTHYTDLEVQTGGNTEQMRFLVTDLGLEDLILGYPWLATFEPTFSWKNASIDTNALPVVIRSLDYNRLRLRPTISRITTVTH